MSFSIMCYPAEYFTLYKKTTELEFAELIAQKKTVMHTSNKSTIPEIYCLFQTQICLFKIYHTYNSNDNTPTVSCLAGIIAKQILLTWVQYYEYSGWLVPCVPSLHNDVIQTTWYSANMDVRFIVNMKFINIHSLWLVDLSHLRISSHFLFTFGGIWMLCLYSDVSLKGRLCSIMVWTIFMQLIKVHICISF